MIESTKIERHIEHLREQHKTIDLAIVEAYNHNEQDHQIQTLKKQKLRLKDEISRLENKDGR